MVADASSVKDETKPPRLILIVDDDPGVRGMLHKLLSRSGFAAIEASSGEEGLEFAAAQRPDLILLDVCLGSGLSGVEVLAALKKAVATSNIPIFVMSGIMTTPEDEARLTEAGADFFITKEEIAPPFHAFLRRIRTHLLLKEIRTRDKARAATAEANDSIGRAPGAAASDRATGESIRRAGRGKRARIVRVGAVELDVEGSRLVVPGRLDVALTLTQTKLLAVLMSANVPLSRKTLHKRIFNRWPAHNSTAIKFHVSELRKKLGALSGLIATDESRRYCFDPSVLDSSRAAGARLATG